jgi:hypothetical protein
MCPVDVILEVMALYVLYFFDQKFVTRRARSPWPQARTSCHGTASASAKSHATGRLAVLARLVASVSPPARHLGEQVSTARSLIFERYIHYQSIRLHRRCCHSISASMSQVRAEVYTLHSVDSAVISKAGSLYKHKAHEAIAATQALLQTQV